MPNTNEIFDNINNEVFLKNIQCQFQPIYSVEHTSISHVEILARWHDKKIGIISPDIFIPIAEKRGILHLIGQKMLVSACDILRYCTISMKYQIKININMSPSELSDSNYEFWLNKLRSKQFNASINIELTEQTNLLDHSESTIKIIKKFQDLGLGLYIDDFGSGFSGFQYIRFLNANSIKLDKHLVKQISSNEKDGKIIKSIINFAHDLNLQVVAEGVESQSQFEILKTLKCDFVQGFYMSKPLDKKDFLKLLKSSKRMDITNGNSAKTN